MSEQGKFLEELEMIKSIAASQNNRLTKSEITKYLSDMNLSEEKMQQVYYYLSLAGIDIEGYRFIPKAVDVQIDRTGENDIKSDSKQESDIEEENTTNREKVKNSPAELSKKRAEYNSRMYMEEIGKIVFYDEKEEKGLVLALVSGDKDARNRFVENRLAQVIKIAQKYADREAVKKEIIGIDELIAEGNLGLLEAVSVIEENKNNFIDRNNNPIFDSIDGTIYMEVTNAIESLLDTMTSDKDWETAVLARTNLLNEAAKYMTEEMGRVPTKEELSEYTKIPVDEIRGIMGLSKDTQRIADTTTVRYRK